MNVVIFGKGFGKPRQLSVSGPVASLAAAVVAFVVVSAGFAGGYWYSAKTGSGVSTTELANLTGEIESQRETIDAIRQENEDTLDALAIRIAQMNARMKWPILTTMNSISIPNRHWVVPKNRWRRVRSRLYRRWLMR
jgi:hypothetical protein